MNRNVVIGVVAVTVLCLGVVGAYFIMDGPTKSDPIKANTPKSASNKEPSVKEATSFKACDILTSDIAKSILGDEADTKPSEQSAEASTADLQITNCMYTAASDKTDITKTSGVTIQARVAKTKTGAATNIQMINNMMGKTRAIDGIGDKAIYSEDFKQIIVLKGNNLYYVWHYVNT
ncbi:hypothetical protein KC949_01150, partial [Candidatus Saccharibacteria bacterium]|nr:hypothetical protein [Candidatus Saccharibacteria bacterium]